MSRRRETTRIFRAKFLDAGLMLAYFEVDGEGENNAIRVPPRFSRFEYREITVSLMVDIERTTLGWLIDEKDDQRIVDAVIAAMKA